MTESTNCFVNEFCTLKLSQDVLQKKKKDVLQILFLLMSLIYVLSYQLIT